MKRPFDLRDSYLEDTKGELTEAEQVAQDKNGMVPIGIRSLEADAPCYSPSEQPISPLGKP